MGEAPPGVARRALVRSLRGKDSLSAIAPDVLPAAVLAALVTLTPAALVTRQLASTRDQTAAGPTEPR